jgi:hypothetical protein
VIPIGPDFQDPVASPNFPPVLYNETPIEGASLMVSRDQRPVVTVFAHDDNPGDTLSYEWVLDYPPFAANTTAVLAQPNLRPPASGPQTQMISLTVTCDLGWALNGPTQRRLQLILSDRPLSGNLDTQLALPGDPVARDNWTVTLSCPPPGSP